MFLFLFCYLYCNQQYFLTPINTVLRYDTSERFDFYPRDLIYQIFPSAYTLEKYTEEIKDEGWNLYREKQGINYLNLYNIDIGKDNTKNWTTIPLKLFGKYSEDNLNKCPRMKSLLSIYPDIQSCLFSIMEPHKIILPHYGPYDGLLRYQLPLDIPICKENEECFLHVNDKKCIWESGISLLFDESNLHGAVNNTSHKRMVLLIDIKRPYNNRLLSYINDIVLKIFSALPATLSATLL